MNPSRFQTVVLLHDQTDHADGWIRELARVLSESHPNVKFLHPPVPTTGSNAQSNLNLLAIRLLPMFQPNSLVVGIGLSGLYAVVLQERFSHLNLSVVAVNPPPVKDGLEVAEKAERVVLYCSQYGSLRTTHPEAWKEFSEAYDVPWLAGGVEKALYATSYVISSYMRGLDLQKEIASLPQAQKEAAGS